MEPVYYKAYDARYRQVHGQGLQWFDDGPSGIVLQTLRAMKIGNDRKLLEIGCGEGRDAFALLDAGYDVLATDVSEAAIAYCRKKRPEYAGHFQLLDCVAGEYPQKFEFIYAVAVIHMLVPDGDRDGFYRFVRKHLTDTGTALICTMGDGETERQTDIRTAFALQERIHEPTGTALQIASTSCRMVDFDTFHRELERNGLTLLREGITAVEPDFNRMMYGIVRRA